MTETGQRESNSYHLTNQISLGASRAIRVGPGERLSIVERYRCDEQFMVFLMARPDLPVPEELLWFLKEQKKDPSRYVGASVKPTDLDLVQVVKSGASHYCLLIQPAWILDDEPIVWHSVLKVIDQNTIATIEEDELDKISADCQIALKAAPQAGEADIAAVLGNFPEFEVACEP